MTTTGTTYSTAEILRRAAAWVRLHGLPDHPDLSFRAERGIRGALCAAITGRPERVDHPDYPGNGTQSDYPAGYRDAAAVLDEIADVDWRLWGARLTEASRGYDHPEVVAWALQLLDAAAARAAARERITDAVATVYAEMAEEGGGWSPEVQRLAWAAASMAADAGLSVTIDTHPDGLRLLVVDGDDVVLDVPYRAGVDQDGCRMRDLDLRPVVAEIVAYDAALPHDRDAVWPAEVSARREALYVRAWHMARAAGWRVGIEVDESDPERPVVAVIVTPTGLPLRGHVRRGLIPEDEPVPRIPWDGQPRDVLGIIRWLAATAS